MKIAIATGVELYNNDILEKFENYEEKYDVEIVHFQDFLLDHEFEIIILTKHLAGEYKIEKLIFELKYQGKRIIFLSSEDIEDRPLIQYCISYGVHDILYKDISPDKIKTIIEQPMQLKDISHLIIEKDEFQIGPVQTDSKKREVERTSKEKKPRKSLLDKFNIKDKFFASNEKKDAAVSPVPITDKNSDKDDTPTKSDINKESKENSSSFVEDVDLLSLVDDEDPFKEQKHTMQEDVNKIVEQEINKLKGEERVSDNKKSLNDVTFEELVLSKTIEGDKSEDEIYETMAQKSNNIKEAIKELEENIVNSNPNRIKGINYGIVAVVGSDRRVGTTHTSLLLAHGARRSGINKVAFVEDNSRDKGALIQKEFFGKDKKDSFKLKGVDYYRSAESISNNMGDYDLIVLDLGYYQESQNKALFKMAQFKVIVSDANFMQRGALIPFCKTHKEQFRNYTYVLPLASQIEKKSFMTFFELKKVVIIPYIRDPFNSNSMTDIIRMIIER